MIHGKRRKKHLSPTLLAYFIQTSESVARKSEFLNGWVAGSAYQKCLTIEPPCWILIERMCGNTTGCSTIGRHDKHIHWTFTIAAKGKLCTVRAPHRMSFIAFIGGQLLCVSALHRYRIQVTHIWKSNLLTIGRDWSTPHPQWFGCLSKGWCPYRQAQKEW